MSANKTFKQFILFTGIGGIGTTGHYLVLIGLVESDLLTAVPASIAGFVVGAIINYLLNYRFTFNSNAAHKQTLSRFLIVAIAGAIINTLLMYAGINLLAAHYLVAQIAATCIVLLWNFTMNKLWTFQN